MKKLGIEDGVVSIAMAPAEEPAKVAVAGHGR
jgi:hypothetical protein